MEKYAGGSELYLQIGYAYNPSSVRDAGSFIITTYINVDGILY